MWMRIQIPDSAAGFEHLHDSEPVMIFPLLRYIAIFYVSFFVLKFSADKASGYRTTTILCMPIKSLNGEIVGVLQAINKRDGIFGATDEEVMNMLATQAGIALQNANLFRHSESARDKFRSLLDIIRAMQGEMGVNSLIFTITQRTIRVVEADRCTLYLVDNVHRGLFAMQGEVSKRECSDDDDDDDDDDVVCVQ